jgi:hypothetical protein
MKYLLFTIITLLSAPAIGQSSLSGLVTDAETGETLLFANLVLKKGKNLISAHTDFDGKYQFKHLSPGTYRLTVNYVGFQTKVIDTLNIQTGAENKLDVQLEANPTLDGEVVILPINADTAEEEKEITVKDLPAKNIHALTGKVAGVTITSGAASKGAKKKPKSEGGAIVIRGSRAEATDYYINGVRVHGGLVHEKAIAEDIPSGQLTAGEWNDLDNWDTWVELTEEDFSSYAKDWQFKPTERYSVKIEANEQRPLPNCQVQLLSTSDEILWEAQTDNKGTAELWAAAFSKKQKAVKIKALYKDKEFVLKSIKPFSKGINKIQFPVGCIGVNSADVCFVIDATSSMTDEIHYLKAEIDDVIQRIQQNNSNVAIRTGSVFYRDLQDAYLTTTSPFTHRFNNTLEFIQNQHAAGGGDIPEAVETALDVAVNQMDWNPEAINRLMFLVLDAPPHLQDSVVEKMQENIRLAAKKGIKIIPLAASGIKKDTEYLMKALAISTNATYTFLTDDSGIGNPHLEPTADVYDVKFLNDLMVEIIDRYLKFEDCPELEELQLNDQPIAAYNNPDLIQLIEYFPNPATDFVNIRLESTFNQLRIKNALGQIIMEKSALEAGQFTLQLPNWAAGLYYLEFIKEEEYTIEKLVIQSEK